MRACVERQFSNWIVVTRICKPRRCRIWCGPELPRMCLGWWKWRRLQMIPPFGPLPSRRCGPCRRLGRIPPSWRRSNRTPVRHRCWYDWHWPAVPRSSTLRCSAAAQAPNAETRLAALEALEIMASPAEVDALIIFWYFPSRAKNEKRPTAPSGNVASRSPTRRRGRLACWPQCRARQPTERSALLPTLARFGGEEVLAAVHASCRSRRRRTERDAGYRALANWPDATVADELLQIARAHEVEAYRFWALRAYARVVSLPSDRDPLVTFNMLRGALELASRQQDKRADPGSA